MRSTRTARSCFPTGIPNIARLPATGDLTVTAPAAWTVIAQGERESRQEAGDVARTRWRQTHPVCWLQVAAGRYHQTARAVGAKTLNVYLLKPDEERAAKVLNTLEQALPVLLSHVRGIPMVSL